MATITKSVGRGGVNQLEDVKTVQNLLNKANIPNEPIPLKVDGRVGEKTFSRIEAFQKKIVFMDRPDGRIDPHGKTMSKLFQGLLISRAAINFTLSSRGLDLLKSIEQLATTPYDDQTGKGISSWVKGATIGYGHLIVQSEWEKYKHGLTESQALQLLRADLMPSETLVNKSLTVAQLQHQFDALVILAFNIGSAAYPSSSVVKLVNDSAAITSYPNLEAAWKAWNKSQGQVSSGLNNRRQSEWDIYSKNVYRKW